MRENISRNLAVKIGSTHLQPALHYGLLVQKCHFEPLAELDFQAGTPQTLWRLSTSQRSLYAQWRLRCGPVPPLRDDDDSPPESLLQAVWQHQRLVRDRLITLDGRPVKVLHPGFRSVEGGPDFRGAVVQLGDEPSCVGDIEIDLRPGGWRAHRHHVNPAFKNVILHVVWDAEQPANGAPPAITLRKALDAPLGQLNQWLGSEAAQSFPEAARGKCCAPLREMDASRLKSLLHDAAQVRLESKAAQIQARARQAGWEQALWEGLFRALGYKHNVWPMLRLAELRPRWLSESPDPLLLQARLFGISGLLPVDVKRQKSAACQHLMLVWDQWWRERDAFADCVLPRSLWRLHGSRPANHPQRRIALTSRWAVDGDMAGRLEKWCGAEVTDRALESSLLQVLQVEPDDFWWWHCTFSSPRLKKAHPLLGAGRVTDLAINVVLPWLWTRAVEGRNAALQKTVQDRYFAWPPAEDNSLLRLARQRLLGGQSPKLLADAASQQGLIQIVRDFCEHSNAICENCKFPELVREFRRA